MYVPAHFAVRDAAPLYDLIEQHAFGLLLSQQDAAGTETGAGLIASHLPFLLDRPAGPDQPARLICHLAAANGQAAALDGQTVLCVFQGPHGYVSPNWYAKKPAVPTWNYQVVHAYGRARVSRDPAVMRGIVDRLSRIYEGPDGWALADEPEAFTAGMLRGIVGVEIPIERLEGKFKLSQNRPPADVAGVIAALRARGSDEDAALAAAMERAAPRRD